MDLLILLQLLLPLCWGESPSEHQPEIKVDIEETVTVQVGIYVTIHCSFPYPKQNNNKSTTFGYWFKGKDQEKLVATNDCQKTVLASARGRFHITGDIQEGNCSLSIAGVQKEDDGIYWFQVEKGHLRYNSSYKTLSVQVKDLTQKPEILIPDILESGRQVILTCIPPRDYRQGTPPNFLWTGAVLSSQCRNSSKFIFIPKAEDHGTNLTCQVTFPETGVTMETTVQLKVACTPRMLGPYCSWTKETLLCTCSVQGEQAPTLYWWVGESMMDRNSSDNTLRVEYKTSGTWTNSSLLLANTSDAVLNIRCEGRNQNVTQTASVQLLVPGKNSNSTWIFLAWMTKGALCGIVMTSLLFTCLIVCLMKMLKKKTQRVSKRDSEATITGTKTKTVSNDSQLTECENSGKHSLSKDPPSPVLVSCSQKGEDQVQYASISFQAKKPQEIPKPEDTQTEYSELKFH